MVILVNIAIFKNDECHMIGACSLYTKPEGIKSSQPQRRHCCPVYPVCCCFSFSETDRFQPFTVSYENYQLGVM